MPRRKQQAPKRLKTDNCDEQEDELEDEKSEDEGFDIPMETDEAGNDDDSVDEDDDYVKKYDTKSERNKTFDKTLRERRYELRDQKGSKHTLNDYSDEDSPLNLSGALVLESADKPSHVVHYLPNLPPTTAFRQDDEAVAQAAAAAAASAAASSLATKSEDGNTLSTAHATWVKSVQELMSFEGNEQIFGCLECNRRFSSNDELVTHLQDTGHITGKPLDPLVNDVSTCKGYDLCIGPNGQLFSKCFLRRHQKRATESDANVCNLRCRQCSKSFPNLLNLTIHMKQSGHYNPNRVNRKKKNKTHHLDYEEEIQVDKVMKCMVCHKSFDALQDLTMHMMETQHFSRVPGYKTETLLQQQQQQHQQSDEVCLDASTAEQQDEPWRIRPDTKSRVVVSDPPIIAAARAKQVTAATVPTSQPAISQRSAVFELPPTIPNDTKMKTVRARLQNKMNSTRVLKCLSCDHSFDSVQSLTKHMTQTGHYQKTSDDDVLVPATEPNDNMVKWELVSAVPTSNGMFTHVKSKVIQNTRHQPLSPESPGVETKSPTVTKMSESFTAQSSQNPVSSQSTPNDLGQGTYSMNTQDKYINPENFDIPMENQRIQFNPLGNLEALVHGASTGQFPARTNNATSLRATAIPERFHTVHWTSSGMPKEERFENSLYNSKHITSHVNPFTMIKSRHKNDSDQLTAREHTSVSVKDEPLDFSIPKHKSNEELSNNSSPGDATVSSTKIKHEPVEAETCEVPLALTVRKEVKNESSSSTKKSTNELEGLAGKIKTEPGKFDSLLTRHSMRVKHLLRLKRMNQLFPPAAVSQPVEAETAARNIEEKKQKKTSPDLGSSEETLSADENDIPIPKEDSTIPRSLYQPVSQNGYLATTKGGVLPMATGAYQSEVDPLKAMDKLVQNAVAGRHSEVNRKVNSHDGKHKADNHEREHDCGLKIAMYGPIMGNDEMASNPLEEIDKLVNAAI